VGLLIKNAKIATSTKVLDADLLIEGDRIARVEPGIRAPGVRTIDAGGLYLLPGGVDVHTHFDLDVGFDRASDDFYTGSVAAACGGTTTVVDHMAFGPAGCRLTHQAEVYRELARHAVIDYGFHGVVQHVNDEVLTGMAALRDRQGISSVKLYLTYDYRLEDDAVLAVLRRAQELNMVVCVHCENDASIRFLRESLVARGEKAPRFHPLSRPAQCEAEAVFRMAMLAKMAGEPKLYIVHLSTALGLGAIRLARQGGQRNLFAETCPQYLLLDDALYQDDQEGLKYIMSPPLRGPADMDALWKGLLSAEIDTVATDHCPFFFATQKQRGAKDFTRCPNGVPGVEARLALLFSEGFSKGRLTLPEVVRLCCTRPAQLMGLAPRKGDILPGADADLVLCDPNIRWIVAAQSLHEHVDYTPYEGIELQGAPVMTISRGEIIVESGVFSGDKGRGQYLRRS